MNPWRTDLVILLITALVLGPASGAGAAPRISVELTTITVIQSGAPGLTVLRALLHLDDQAALGPVVFNFSLDPGLPFDTARLMIPFSVEEVDVLGTRLGLTGVRLLWNPDSATRVRGVLLDDS